MKRIVWNITLASVITLVLYVALYVIWGAIFSNIDDQSLRFLLIALMTAVAFGYLLLYTSKIKRAVGEDEVISDYKERAYVSFVDDFKLIIKRELKTIICVVGIVCVCGIINTVEQLIFQKATNSILTFPFVGMIMLGSVIDVPFVGYILNALLDCFVYIVFLLFYRRRKYKYWIKNKV